MKNLELYIGNERVDLFDFESITLNQVIKDVKDIGKIFTDYSQSFKVPASANNNRIFKHYYNYNILDGYDARFKAEGSIKMGGADFRFGKMRLDDVDMKDNKPYAYKIVFFGSSVGLTEILGDDDLANLDYLNKFNHNYNKSTVRAGLTNGLKYDSDTSSATYGTMVGGSEGDIIYPFISCYSYYYYNSDTSDHGQLTLDPPSRNLHKQGSAAHNGIEYTDLKPSIKVRHIINAIEDKYEGLFFDKTWLDTAPFNELYLHLHRDKGAITDTNSSETVFTQQDFGVNLDLGSLVTDRYTSYTLTYSISPVTGTGPYSLRVVDTISGQTLGYSNGLDSDGSVVLDYNVLSSEEPRNWNLNFYITTEEGTSLSTFNASLGITKKSATLYLGHIIVGYTFEDFTFTSPNSPETLVSYVVVTSQIPKMKVIDFLQSIFKMFNLTAYFQRNDSLPSKSSIMIQPLDSYYSSGNVIDISDYVDISETTVSRPPTYSEISFKYEKPQTFGIKNQNELLNDEFGDLTRDNRDLASFVADGGKYQVKVGFEHLLFERTKDPNNVNYSTPFQYGWLVDDNENTIKTKPIIHFAVMTSVNTSIYEAGFTGATNVITNPIIEQYFRPSNSNSNGSQTINFNSEYDEYTGIENTNSLYRNFYSSYIEKSFSKSSRLVTMNANLPLSVLLRYELNDVFRVNGLDYNINKLKTNLLTGKSKIELISGSFADEIRPDPPSLLYVVNRGTDNMNISWMVAQTGVKAVYYATYIDGVGHGFGDITYTGSTPNIPNALLRGLVAGQTYSIQTSSISIDGVESYKSEVLLASTTTGSVTPSDPSNLSLVSRTDNSILLTWNLSYYDLNSGETGYDVYGRIGTSGDFFLYSSISSQDFGTASFEHNVTGLSAGTNYQFKVSAYDSYASYPNSGFSNTLSTQTTDVTDLVPPSVPSEFTASNITTTGVTLSWLFSSNQDGTLADGYRVYQGTTEIADVTTSTAYNVTGLTSGTLYKFFVSSYDANGNESNTAGPLNVTTLPLPSLTNATFQQAVNDCLAQEPVTGDYFVTPYGKMKDWNTSGVTNMNTAFFGKATFNGDITGWDTSNVTTMQSMFQGAGDFNQAINSWDVSNVTAMNSMFASASDFNQSLSSWDVSNVTNMGSMFEAATSFNGNITGWITTSVTSMSAMFKNATAFNVSVGGWNTSTVTNMSSMFQGASLFNNSLNNWNVSNVLHMQSMFTNASVFNQPINGWNVSNVTNMAVMFSNADAFNQDLNSWVTTSVTNMANMFQFNGGFNGNITGWNTSGVTDMGSMFAGATAFNKDLSTWVVNPNVTDCANFDLSATAWVLARPSFTSCTI